MKNYSILVLLTVLTLFLPSARAALVVSEGAILRSGPGTEHSEVVKLQVGDEVRVIEKQGDWYLGETEDNHVGWVQGSVLKNIALDMPSPTPTPLPVVKPETKPKATPTPPAVPTESSTQATQNLTQDTTSPSKPMKENEHLSKGDYMNEFKELSLAIRPGLAKATSRPTGMDKDGLSIGAHLAFFVHKYLALNVPYTYTRYSKAAEMHTVGGGPLIRFVDWGPIRGEVDGNYLYARAFGKNHQGWNFGGDLSFGFRNVKLKPFIGPFVRFEHIYLPGKDLNSVTSGVGLTLTNLADFD